MNKTNLVRKIKWMVENTNSRKGYNIEATEMIGYYKNVCLCIIVEQKDTAWHTIIVKAKYLMPEPLLTDKSDEYITETRFYKGIDDDETLMYFARKVEKGIAKLRRSYHGTK